MVQGVGQEGGNDWNARDKFYHSLCRYCSVHIMCPYIVGVTRVPVSI